MALDYWTKGLADVQAGRRTDITRKGTGSIPTFDEWKTSYQPATYVGSGRTQFDDYGNATGRTPGIQTGGSANPAEYDYLNEFYNLPSYAGAGNFLERTLHNGPLIAAGLGAGLAGAYGSTLGAGEAVGGGSGFGGGFGGETFVPGGDVLTAADAAATGATGTAATGTAANGTALSRLLGLNPSQADWLSVLGTAGATGLGMFSANKKAGALKDIANQSRADRAPFLNKANEYLANPSAYIEGPGQAAMQGTLHGLSAKFGNPIGSGAALQIATNSALQDWRNATTGFANIGLSGEDTRAQLMAGSAGADADVFTTLAGGASDLINPRRTLADLVREYKQMGLI